MGRPPLPHVVFLDACVLYPSQEDFLASLERSGLRRFAQAVKEFRHML